MHILSPRRLVRAALLAAAGVVITVACSSNNTTTTMTTTTTTIINGRTTTVTTTNSNAATPTATVVLPSMLPHGSNGLFQNTQGAAANEASLADLDAVITDRRLSAQLAGMSVCLTKNRVVQFCRGYGYANIDIRRMAAPATPFLVGPVSELVTAVVALKAYQDKVFGLDDALDALPGIAVTHPSGQAITFGDLLAQMGGIQDTAGLDAFVTENQDGTLSLADAVKGYLDPGGAYFSAANFTTAAPGTAYLPSSMGFSLLGLKVEQLTGGSFATYASEQVFQPSGLDPRLQLEETGYRLADLEPYQLAVPYHPDPSNRMGFSTDGIPAFADYPGRGLHASARDLALLLTRLPVGKFIAPPATGPNPPPPPPQPDDILSADDPSTHTQGTFSMAITVVDPQVDPRQGLGFRHRQIGSDGADWVGQRGGQGDTWAEMYVRLSDGLGMVILTNGAVTDEQPIDDIENELIAYAAGL
jgi:CubicO group peptidase (beta-lactamase class C family)